MAATRGWWRNYFEDHPLYRLNQSKTARPAIVWANTQQDKIRVFCRPCLDLAIGNIVQDEEEQSAQGRQILMRTRDAIKLDLFNVQPNQPGGRPQWLEARKETLISHLKDCTLQPEAVRRRALDERDSDRRGTAAADINATPRSQRTYHTPIISPQPVVLYTQPPPIAQWEGMALPGPRPPTAMSTSMTPQPADPFQSAHTGGYVSHYPFPTSSTSLPQHIQDHPSATLPMMTQEAISRLWAPATSPTYSHASMSGSTASSGSFNMPSISRAGTPASAYSNPGAKRQRTTTGASLSRRPSQAALSDAVHQWDANDQQAFEVRLARMIASAGLSFNFVSNPEFLLFCQTYIPLAKVPSRKVISSRVLPQVLRDIRNRNQREIAGRPVTVQCDGWTGPNSHHLIAFMITTSAGNVYTVKVYDTTVERKTAENLLALMKEVLDIIRNDWCAIPIAFCTDASGESKKARRLLREEQPDLVTPDCYAHQINLIVGDYFKTNNVDFLSYASQANDLITWLRSKTAVLGLIKQALASHGRTPLSVIRPVPTRWTAYYLAYRRLLDLRSTLEFIVAADAQRPEDQRLIIPREPRVAREKATAMVNIIKDNFFWISLARIKHHLAPLAISANVTQSSHCRLDEVLLTFASLSMEFSRLTDPVDQAVKQALLSSIEKRWDQSDQEVFIAAIILNPFLKTVPFCRDPGLISQGAVDTLLSGLWTRFFKEDPPSTLYNEIDQYLESTGDHFSNMIRAIENHQARAASRGESPRPLDVYADITIKGVPPPPLIRLAIHILSICPNSASCERLFSTFGLILTKLRTRLQNQRVVDLAECKMHIRDEHLAAEAKKNLRKRVFGVRAEKSSTSHSTPAAAPTNTPVLPTSDTPHPDPDTDINSPTPTTSRTTESLRLLASRHIAMLDEVQESSLSDGHTTRASTSTRFHKRRIDRLFDFTSTHWIQFAQRGAVGSLNDEMELYDLLDLDAEGDLDYDLDDCLESVLTV